MPDPAIEIIEEPSVGPVARSAGPSPASPRQAPITVVPGQPPSEPGRDAGPQAEPPKPGTARSRLFDNLKSRGKPGAFEAAQQPEPPKPAAGQPKPAAATPAPATPAGEPVTPKPGDQPATTPDKKANPWKLVDQWKGRATQLEQELVQAKSGSIPQKEREEYTSKLTTLEKRNQELENAIRFVDYKESDEFKKKYEEPYKQAWARHGSELSEIPVKDAQTGEMRAATPQDLLNLVNLPLGEARAKANEQFGDFADDVMAARKEIKGLFDAQTAALKEARESGGARSKQQQEQAQKAYNDAHQEALKFWKESNEAAAKDEANAKYFTPVEGDQDGNLSLAKGFEFVDDALSQNPLDPRLSSEDRNKVVRKHTALRNRAAAYGRLKKWVASRDARIAELEKELGQYRASEPGTGPGTPTGGQPTGAPSARADIFARLRQRAK